MCVTSNGHRGTTSIIKLGNKKRKLPMDLSRNRAYNVNITPPTDRTGDKKIAFIGKKPLVRQWFFVK
jgi:hypothetical protein